MKVENYELGLSSNKYCFADFILSSLKEDSVSEIIEMKALKYSTVIMARSIQESKVYEENKHLLKWFNDKLEIDFDSAIKLIDKYINENYTYVTHRNIFTKIPRK